MSRKIDWIKTIASHLQKTTRFEQCLKNMQYVTISKGRCVAEITITEDQLNKAGHFHEGLTTTLVDITSNYALLSHRNGSSSVSTNIHVSHLQPAFPGEVISIDAKVCRVIPPLAYAEVVLTKKNTEEIVACGQQTLFMKPMEYKP